MSTVSVRGGSSIAAVPLALALSSLAAAAQAVSSPGVSARVTKVNAPLVKTSGDVTAFELTPDGTRVFFRAPRVDDVTYELFTALADGSAPAVVLNDPLVAGGDVSAFRAAPAAGRVLYLADQDTNDVTELFSVPDDGSASPVRLNLTLGAGEIVYEFWIGANQDVFFRAGTVPNNSIYRVPIDGSAPASFVANVTLGPVWFSPDWATLVYGAPLAERVQLFQVPTDGSAAPTLVVESQPASAFGSTYFDQLTFSDDGTRIVVYDVRYDDGITGADLLTAALDGSYAPHYLNQLPMALNGTLRPYAYDGDERVVLFDTGLVTIALDGSQRVALDPPGWSFVVLSDDRSQIVFNGQQGGVHGLFRAPIDGSQPAVRLASSTVPIASAEMAGSTVVYSVQVSLWAVPLAGGQPPLLLNPPPFDDATGEVLVHPGGQDVLFRAQHGTAPIFDLCTAPLDGSTPPRQLSVDLVENGVVFTYAVAGPNVAYLADAHHNDVYELFGVPFAGGATVTYNGPLDLGPVVGDVLSYTVSNDGRRLLYRADQDTDEVVGLYVARTSGAGTPASLTNGLPADRNVFAGMVLSPGGARAAFVQASSPGATSGRLYAASTTAPSTPILLDARSGLVQQNLLATSARVVYLRLGSAPNSELCSARLDGLGSALTLTPASATLSGIQLAADGSEAFYLADAATSGVIELQHVPLDGSAPPARLNAPLSGNLDVTAFALAPGGARVVYVADAAVNNVFELYVVPSDGSAPAQKLNGALVAGGDVSDFVVTPDGAFVVYRADQRVDQCAELFRVPITGGTPTLLTPIGAGIGVQSDYLVSADGQMVYYRATQAGPIVLELYRTASDGSSGPVRLSGALTPGGDVNAFALAPDQAHLVYLADQRVDDVMELFGVTATPGTDVLLHALPASGDVDVFRIAPDSRAVFYRADVTDTVLELFAAPLDGSSAAVRVNRPLPPGGDVENDDVENDIVPLSGGFVLYRADQETNNVTELFDAGLEHGPRSATPKRVF